MKRFLLVTCLFCSAAFAQSDSLVPIPWPNGQQPERKKLPVQSQVDDDMLETMKRLNPTGGISSFPFRDQQTMMVGECANGECANTRRQATASGGGWNTPPRPTQRPTNPPIAPPVITPGAQGIQGPKGDNGKDGADGAPGKDADEQAILLALFQKIKSDPQFKGTDGVPGKDAVVDYQKLADEVKNRLPAFMLQFTDKNGQVVEEVPFTFNAATNSMSAKVGPLTVETYDANGKLTDADQYPIPYGIKLKPIIIPAVKGT